MHPHSSPTRWNRLGCLRGISALTGLALTVEMGDWSRFTGSAIGAYVGLVLCEDSSGNSDHIAASYAHYVEEGGPHVPQTGTAIDIVALTHFAARAGDHNDRAMIGSRIAAQHFAQYFGAEPVVIGAPEPALSVDWEEELSAAMPALTAMSQRYQQIFTDRLTPVTALSRCAVALATLPIVTAHRPDAVVVWFDAHADLNTPSTTPTGYLGGLALSGPLGWWNSGLGAGLQPRNAVLVGVRDVDTDEKQLIDKSEVALIRIGTDLPHELRRIIDGRPTYIHIDCDVMEPGVVLTDYSIPNGLTPSQLNDAAGFGGQRDHRPRTQ